MVCPRVFVKDPELFLQDKKVTVQCLVHPERPAVVSPELRAMVNYEIYYFSDKGALRRFRKDPLRYCGIVTDPVNRVRFHPTERSPLWVYHDRPYYFSADSTLTAFH